MLLIDTSYFVGSINIPNIDKIEVSENLEIFIEEYENKMLPMILGYDLAKALKEGYTDIEDKETVEQRWKNLINGVEYTNCNNQLVKWDGLLQVKEISSTLSLKKSIIANYVYYWYVRNNVSQTTGVGEVINKSENSSNASSDFKLARAYNEMLPIIKQLFDFLNANKANYPEWELGYWYVAENLKQWQTVNPIF